MQKLKKVFILHLYLLNSLPGYSILWLEIIFHQNFEDIFFFLLGNVEKSHTHFRNVPRFLDNNTHTNLPPGVTLHLLHVPLSLSMTAGVCDSMRASAMQLGMPWFCAEGSAPEEAGLRTRSPETCPAFIQG